MIDIKQLQNEFEVVKEKLQKKKVDDTLLAP
jgi:seryl-tRNA synthetase